MNQKQFRLGCLTRHFLAYETPEFSFSSHMVVETSTRPELARVVKTAEILFSEIPYLRSRIDGGQRTELEKNSFQWSRTVRDLGTVKMQDLSEVVGIKFNLESEPALRFAIGTIENGNHFLVLSVHHALMDGLGQINLLNEFVLGYQGLPLSSWVKKPQDFLFSKALFRNLSPAQGVKLVLFSLKNLLKGSGGKGPSGSLAEKNGNTRSARYFHILIDDKEMLIKKRANDFGFDGFFPFLLFCLFRVIDRMRSERKDVDLPLTALVPINLRTTFKIKRTFQNIVGLGRIRFSSDEIRARTFSEALNHKIKSELTPIKAFSLIMILGLTNRLVSFKKMKEFVLKREYGSNPAASTIFVSAGKIPYFGGKRQFFDGFLRIERIYGYGSLTRSPGLGVILTGIPGKQVLTIQYLPDLFESKTIRSFCDQLWLELTGETLNLDI